MPNPVSFPGALHLERQRGKNEVYDVVHVYGLFLPPGDCTDIKGYDGFE